MKARRLGIIEELLSLSSMSSWLKLPSQGVNKPGKSIINHIKTVQRLEVGNVGGISSLRYFYTSNYLGLLVINMRLFIIPCSLFPVGAIYNECTSAITPNCSYIRTTSLRRKREIIIISELLLKFEFTQV